MNLESTITQLDDTYTRKNLIRSRANVLRDDLSVSSASIYGSQVQSVLFKEKTDLLYGHFLAVIQSSSNELEIFDTIQHLRQVLENTIDDMQVGGKKLFGPNNWIRQEMNTWSLIHCLYKDRLITQKEEMEQDDLPLVNSEKLIVEHLYLSKLLLIS